jgi:hypothetical protein
VNALDGKEVALALDGTSAITSNTALISAVVRVDLIDVQPEIPNERGEYRPDATRAVDVQRQQFIDAVEAARDQLGRDFEHRDFHRLAALDTVGTTSIAETDITGAQHARAVELTVDADANFLQVHQ